MQYGRLRSQSRERRRAWRIVPNRPCLSDYFAANGPPGGHYFHQDLLVASRIFQRAPNIHVDVGSSVAGFVAHLAVFRSVEVFDIRPMQTVHKNISYRQCDLTQVPTSFKEYCDSLSCLHALEHFGLGRYGDALDIDGHLHGLNSLTDMLVVGGILYLSVPIGLERIEFNGHRIFSVATILSMTRDAFELMKFSYVDDDGALHEDVTLDAHSSETSFDLQYGCGIFELRKIRNRG
jgi:hypothetical protein